MNARAKIGRLSGRGDAPGFFVLVPERNDTHALLSNVPDVIEDEWELLEGVSRADSWPENVLFPFCDDDGYEQRTVATDWMDSIFQWLVISDAFKKVMEDFRVPDVEYLPAGLKNQQGEILPDRYWVGNFVRHRKAVDTKACQWRPATTKGQIRYYTSFALQKDLLSTLPPMFRLAETPELVIVRQDLRDALAAANMTGVRFVPAKDYTSRS